MNTHHPETATTAEFLAALRTTHTHNPTILNRITHGIGDQDGQILETVWNDALDRLIIHVPQRTRDTIQNAADDILTDPQLSYTTRHILLGSLIAIAARNERYFPLYLQPDVDTVLHPWTHIVTDTTNTTDPTPERTTPLRPTQLLPPPPPLKRKPATRVTAANKTSTQSTTPPRTINTFPNAIQQAHEWARETEVEPPPAHTTITTLAAFIFADALQHLSGVAYRGTVRGAVDEVFNELGTPTNVDQQGNPIRGTLLHTLGQVLHLHEKFNGAASVTSNNLRALDALFTVLELSTPQRTDFHRELTALLAPPHTTTRATPPPSPTQPPQGEPKLAPRTPTPTTPAAPVVGEEDDLPTLLRELDALPGLTNVKDIVKEQTALVALNQERELRHLPPVPVNRHMVFTGEPGTGKTTIARLVGKIYKAMGVLRTGHLVETDRAGLIGQYLGSTVAKTTKTITSALGGVLFIDEAYALIEQGFTKGDAFGAEAVNTLVKAMEDHRHDLVVILAGYPNEMDTFIHTNPGLASRVGRTVHFNTYTPTELVHILHHHTRTHHLHLTPDAETAALKVFTDRTFHGNGRGVRNLLEAATASLATRLHTTPTTDLDDTTLTTLRQCDIDTAATKLDTTPRITPIGFITD